MIVKVVHPKDYQSTVFQADHGPVTFGTWYFDDPVSDGRRSYGGEILPHGENVQTHCVGINEGAAEKPSHIPGETGQWRIRYAWWQEPTCVVLVVSSGEIYLLSDRGDTVDRVR